MNERSTYERARELVFEVSKLPRDQRAGYLEGRVDGDVALLAEVRSLLEWLDDTNDPAASQPDEPDLAAGSLLEERYRIEAKLGQGSSGAVYRAHDELLGLPVAIKRAQGENPHWRERLRREAVLARGIQHPNVRRIYDVLPSNGEFYLVMEFVEGRDLGRRLVEDGPIGADEVAALGLDIASGLAAMHEAGIVHGDLKPENVILRASGSAVITDFGMSYVEADRAVDEPRGGTPRYLSPERNADAPSSPSSDVYALAVLLSDLLLGRTEEAVELGDGAIDLGALVPEVDPKLEHAIARGLLPEPLRPTHAGAWAELLRAGPRLAPSASAGRRPVTALWCEFQSLDDERPSEVLRERQRAIEIVRTHGGIPVEAWSTSGLLALFGVFASNDRQDMRAVRAALRMAAEMREPDLRSPCVTLETQVMDVLFDEAGSPILGRSFGTLRETARGARAGSVTVSDAMRASMGDRFALRQLDVPGRYEVLFECCWNSIDVALRAGRARAVGRASEEQRILARWESVRTTGRGSVVAVHGAAGIGKTRLIGEVGLALREACRWIEVTCPDQGAGPLEPWRWVIEQLTGESVPPFGLTDFLLGTSGSGLEPRLRQALVTDALVGRLQDLGRRTPTVLVLEDVHWSDPASLHVLARVAAEIEALGLLLIVSWRSEFTRFEVASSWEKVALGPLDARAAEAMLADLLACSDEDSRRLIERSAGVPLFLEHLAIAARQGASLETIPPSLQALLLARLDALGSGLAVARAAAVIGRQFTRSTLARVTRLEAAALERALHALTESGLIEPAAAPPADALRFVHSLQHQSAYESIPSETRRSLHDSCITAIQAIDTASLPDRSLALARHCEGAGRTSEAIEWWADAAGLAAAVSAHASAVEYLQRALALHPEPKRELEIRLAMLQAQQITMAFGSSATSENAERALELLQGASDPVLSRPTLALGRTYLARADLRLKTLADRIDPLAERSADPWLRFAWFTQCGNRELVQGRLQRAREWFRRGFEGLDRAIADGLVRRERPDPRTFALTGLALLDALQCRAGASVHAEQALALTHESGDYAARGFALIHLAQGHLVRRDVRSALPLLAEVDTLIEAHRLDGYGRMGTLFRACAEAQAGDPDLAADAIRRCLVAREAEQFVVFEGFGLSHLALAEERRGNERAAREAVERGIHLAGTTLDGSWLAELHRQLAPRLASAGVAGVAAEYERAVLLARAQDAVVLEMRALVSLASWHPEPGGSKRARATLARLVERPGLDPTSEDLLEARALLAASG